MIPGAAPSGSPRILQGPMTEETKRDYTRKPKDEPMTEETPMAAEAPVFVRKTAKELAVVPVEDPIVTVRVLKMGADKISTGLHLAELGDEFYAQGETFTVAKSIGSALEARGFVEIQ